MRLGEWNAITEPDCDDGDCAATTVDIPVEQTIIHQQYQPSSKNQHHDIALLRLARNVQYSKWVSPICLPTAQHLRSTTHDNIELITAGWGATENG